MWRSTSVKKQSCAREAPVASWMSALPLAKVMLCGARICDAHPCIWLSKQETTHGRNATRTRSRTETAMHLHRRPHRPAHDMTLSASCRAKAEQLVIMASICSASGGCRARSFRHCLTKKPPIFDSNEETGQPKRQVV